MPRMGKKDTVKRTARVAGDKAAPGAAAVGIGNNGNVTGQAMIDLEFLRGLIDAVDQSGIDSLEISRAGTRIRISKSAPPVAMTSAAPAGMALQAMPAPLPHPHVTPAPMVPMEESAEAAEAAASAAAASKLYEVKSPMVGTFYRSPAPEAPAYVEVGAPVTKGQTLCILEAMKLMNELESDVEGTVREILVGNAEPVEYGQVLFRIELK